MLQDIVLPVPETVVIPASLQLVVIGMVLGAAAFYCALTYAVVRHEGIVDHRITSLLLSVSSIILIPYTLPGIFEAVKDYEAVEDRTDRETDNDTANDNTYIEADWLDDETEKKHSKMAYDALADVAPVSGFDEVTAAIVVGFDGEDNSHILGAACENQQNLITSLMLEISDVVRDYEDGDEP